MNPERVLATLIVTLLLAGCSSGLEPGGAWRDASGESIDTDRLWAWRGPEDHCGWGSATFLWIGREASVPGIDDGFHDQYVRDPEGLFGEMLSDTFVVDVDLPPDADDTGYSTSTLRLWISPSVSTAVFIEVADRFEKWPRVGGTDPILCA